MSILRFKGYPMRIASLTLCGSIIRIHDAQVPSGALGRPKCSGGSSSISLSTFSFRDSWRFIPSGGRIRRSEEQDAPFLVAEFRWPVQNMFDGRTRLHRNIERMDAKQSCEECTREVSLFGSIFPPVWVAGISYSVCQLVHRELGEGVCMRSVGTIGTN